MMTSRRTERAARELFRFCVADGRLDSARVREVARRLAASRTRGAVAVLAAFARLVRLDLARRTALVESATALTPGARSDIQARITHIYGPSSLVTFTENPALIGGVRVRVGSHVYDRSVRARLSALEARL